MSLWIGESLGDILKDFGEMHVKAEAVETVSVEKEEQVFRFSVDGCVYANPVHGDLNERKSHPVGYSRSLSLRPLHISKSYPKHELPIHE